MKNVSIFLFGPPCAGKSYVSQFILEKYPSVNYYSISSILKDMAMEDTSEARDIAFVLMRGDIVSLDIVFKAFSRIKTDGVNLIDGFPRNTEQLQCLKDLNNINIIHLAVDDDEIIRRAGLRRICSDCGFIHLEADDKRCPKCRTTNIEQRADDDKIKHRLLVYKKNTIPVIAKLKELYSDNFYVLNSGLDISVKEMEVIVEQILEEL